MEEKQKTKPSELASKIENCINSIMQISRQCKPKDDTIYTECKSFGLDFDFIRKLMGIEQMNQSGR